MKKKPIKPPAKQSLEEALAALSEEPKDDTFRGFSVSGDAGSKFKAKRRGKPASSKQLNMGVFLEWFEGSQALERIVTLER